MQTADIIIVGGGLYGCATAFHLARLGAQRTLVLERGTVGGGGTAKSCAIVRTHYSITANLIHAVHSLNIFAHFDDLVGGDVGWRQTGYLIVGPESHREAMQAVFATQNRYGIDTAVLTPEEANEIHPLLSFHDVDVIGYDSMTGYADPHLLTSAYASRARDVGVRIETHTPVTTMRRVNGLYQVETPTDTYESPILLLAAGPWTNKICASYGLTLPYVVSRHKVLTLRINQPYQPNWPTVKDLTTADKIYFRPETGGVVLVGTGDHGDPITDPDTLQDYVDAEHISRIQGLMSNRMPAFADAEVTATWTGPYDITPDWNPLVGSVADQPGLYVATGFSGHGFKLAPTISQSLAEVMVGRAPQIPIDMYSPQRFATGRLLEGVYGIGSIS